MHTEKANRIAYWDSLSLHYASQGVKALSPFSDAVLSYIPDSKLDNALDIASGPGTLSLPLSGHAKSVCAIDLSSPMLQTLKAAAQQENIQNIHAIHGNGECLPFSSESFDATFSMFGIMFFSNIERGFQEAFRVSKKGSINIFTTWASRKDTSLYPELTRIFEILGLQSTELSEESLLANKENLSSVIKNNNYRSVEVISYETEIAFVSAIEFWERVSYGSATITGFRNNIADYSWETYSREVLNFLEIAFNGKKRPLTKKALFGIGRK